MQYAQRKVSAQNARLTLLILFSLATLVALRGLLTALAQRVALELVLGPTAWPLIGLCAAALAAALFGLLRAQGERSAASLPSLPVALGALLLVAVASWVFALICVQPMQALWFDLGLGMTAGLWCALLLTLGRESGPVLMRRGRWLVTLAATILLAELALRALAAVHPLPILARTADAPRHTIERFRCAPGELRFGFRCNERGFYDEPFVRRAPEGELVAVIGDSFGVGVVPHARHYTSVAEQQLGVTIANIGVAGCGPPEYLSLLADEALPLDPDTVVLALFVGNDFEFESGERPGEWLRDVFARERTLLWVLPGRLLRLQRTREAARDQSAPLLAADPEAALAGLDDALLEQASLPPDAFLRLETQRARAVCAGEPASLPELEGILLQARELCGARRFAVLLIPDEFQVEDDLWNAVLERADRELDREAPQRALTAWLASQGIATLDLLPGLRATAPLADGRRHVYHLRDTHFNARGNRVAGLALAEFLNGLRRE